MSDDLNVTWIGDVQRLVMTPDDILVVSVDVMLNVDNTEKVKSAIGKILKDYGHHEPKVIVIGKGMKLGVLAAEQRSACVARTQRRKGGER